MGSIAYVDVAILTEEEELEFQNGTRAIFGNITSVAEMQAEWEVTPSERKESYLNFEDFCYEGYDAFIYSKWKNFNTDLYFEKIVRPYDKTRMLYMLIIGC